MGKVIREEETIDWKCTTSVSSDSRVLSDGSFTKGGSPRLNKNLTIKDRPNPLPGRGMAPSMEQIASSTSIEKGTSFDPSSLHPPHPHTENSHTCDTCRNWTLIVFRQEVPAQGPGYIS